MLILIASLLSQQAGMADEAALRAAFAQEFKEREPFKRIDALRKLGSMSEEKTLVALAGGLRDLDARVRKEAAEVMGSCTDLTGAGIKPLCASLLHKKEDPEVRLACARSLARGMYKAEAIDALIQTISGIGEQEKALYAFGASCTKVLSDFAGQDFGAGKETPDNWKAWWKDNRARVVREDQAKLPAKKAAKGK